MKKKLLAMLLAVVMVCGVSGCGKDKTDATDGQQVTAELDGEMKKEADTLQKAAGGLCGRPDCGGCSGGGDVYHS